MMIDIDIKIDIKIDIIEEFNTNKKNNLILLLAIFIDKRLLLKAKYT